MNDMAMTGCTSEPTEPRKQPTIADYSAKLHITLVEARSTLGYIIRNVLGGEIPDLAPQSSNCYMGALEYDVGLANDIMVIARELAEKIGGTE